MHHEDQEIVRHGIIGALVAVALAAFHQVAESFAQVWSTSPNSFVRTAGQMAGWLALFGAVFTAIFVAEQYIRRMQWKAPIHLDDLGLVDGQWVQVSVMDGKIRSGGIFEISSAVGEGFRMSGVSYDATSAGVERHLRGRWRSKRGVHISGTDVAYVFEGTTSTGVEHFGAGFYRFSAVSGSSDLAVEGSFLVRQDKSARHIIGRRISKVPLAEKDAFAVLSDYIRSSSVIGFETTKSFEAVSSV